MQNPAVLPQPPYPMAFVPPLFTVMPPFRMRAPGEPLFPNPASFARAVAQGEEEERIGLKERNRVAAQKWREKKDRYLLELEGTNDGLRKQALALNTDLLALKVENRTLEEELAFFQGFMSRMMARK
jgi:hypothetical protein